MVGDAQANPRMGAVERAEHGQKKAVQRRFARADGDHAALQAAVAGQLLLARLNLFTGDGNARKQLFALRREHRAAVAAHKERTAERRFQIADGSGKVGLAGQQRPGGFGEAAEPGDGVENAIGIVADEHGDSFRWGDELLPSRLCRANLRRFPSSNSAAGGDVGKRPSKREVFLAEGGLFGGRTPSVTASPCQPFSRRKVFFAEGSF